MIYLVFKLLCLMKVGLIIHVMKSQYCRVYKFCLVGNTVLIATLLNNILLSTSGGTFNLSLDSRQVIGFMCSNYISFQSMKMYLAFFLIILCVSTAYAKNGTVSSIVQNNSSHIESLIPQEPVGCLCGVFLSGQFKKGTKEQPTGNPALLHEHPDSFPCNPLGNKLCTSKCLDVIVKHLPNSPSILCAAIDRDCLKERAYLFIKNCKDEWINTNLSAGREYCCKDGIPYKCPTLWTVAH